MSLNWPLEQSGSQGQTVMSVQYLLNTHGLAVTVDGDFGPLTEAAVKSFQASQGLTADGIVGDLTWPALIVEISIGSQGDAVKAIQSQVDSRMKGSLVIDGIFGNDTQVAVQAFQRILGLTIDGIVGPITWNAYVAGYLAATNALESAQALYLSWTQNNRDVASMNATPDAVAQLFAQSWSSTAGWIFVGGDGAAGTIYYTWEETSGHKLVLAASDGPAGYFYVDGAQFQ